MIQLRRAFLISLAIGTMGACKDSPTGPAADLTPTAIIGIAVVPDPTLVTFNSASCSLTSALTGTTSCSWNISNPAEHVLHLSAEVLLTATYNCVNPNNGRIGSAEQRELSTLVQQFSVSATTLTGSNVAIPQPFLPVDNTGRLKKENACKGNQIVQALSYQVSRWRVSVITVGGTLRTSCFASDNLDGCFTS